MTEVRVTSKGQVTIPVDLRRKHKIEEGGRVEITEEDGKLVIKRKASFLDLAGIDAALNHIEILENRGATITDIDKEVAIEAGKLLNKHPNAPIADALIAATHNQHSAEYIVTEDKHFDELGCKTRWI